MTPSVNDLPPPMAIKGKSKKAKSKKIKGTGMISYPVGPGRL
jgi:hypothetical protein